MTIKNKSRRSLAQIAAIAGILTIVVSGCTGSSSNHEGSSATANDARKQEKVAQYTCSMHPEVLKSLGFFCSRRGIHALDVTNKDLRSAIRDKSHAQPSIQDSA